MKMFLNPKLDKEHFDLIIKMADIYIERYKSEDKDEFPIFVKDNGLEFKIHHCFSRWKVSTYIETIYGLRNIELTSMFKDNMLINSVVRMTYQIPQNGYSRSVFDKIDMFELRMVYIKDQGNNFILVNEDGIVSTSEFEYSESIKGTYDLDLPIDYFNWNEDQLMMLKLCA